MCLHKLKILIYICIQVDQMMYTDLVKNLELKSMDFFPVHEFCPSTRIFLSFTDNLQFPSDALHMVTIYFSTL
jgi:hypothetical protein